jgi:hypothetical protein
MATSKAKAPTPIRFEAVLQRPASPARASWSFLVLPKAASAQLPARSTVAVEGHFAGQPLWTVLPPDGQGGHWLKVERALCEAAGVAVGDTVTLEIVPSANEPEPVIPTDLRAALAAADDGVRTNWKSLKAGQRRDWIDWIVQPKKPETRARRIAAACDMLASGKRKVCCFDRSGMYGGGFAAPQAAET